MSRFRLRPHHLLLALGLVLEAGSLVRSHLRRAAELRARAEWHAAALKAQFRGLDDPSLWAEVSAALPDTAPVAAMRVRYERDFESR